KKGNPRAFAFPRGLASTHDGLDFTFSGLKTAVRYAIAGPGRPDFSQLQLSAQQIADTAASFQEAVVDSLLKGALRALEKTRLSVLCVGGGVAANQLLRERLADAAQQRSFELHIAPRELCTDNAVMGAIAFERLQAGQTEPLELDILPGLVRG